MVTILSKTIALLSLFYFIILPFISNVILKELLCTVIMGIIKVLPNVGYFALELAAPYI